MMPDTPRLSTADVTMDWDLEAVATLVDERDRYREALTRIHNHGETHDEPCWAVHNGDCADTMQEIARAALDG